MTAAHLCNSLIKGQPDQPSTTGGLVRFRDGGSGRTVIFMGSRQIGEIVISSWLRATVYRVTIHLGTHPRRITASTLDQAKVFAEQEVLEFFAGTPVKVEVPS
jgi:hypothetical protein